MSGLEGGLNQGGRTGKLLLLPGTGSVAEEECALTGEWAIGRGSEGREYDAMLMN